MRVSLCKFAHLGNPKIDYWTQKKGTEGVVQKMRVQGMTLFVFISLKSDFTNAREIPETRTPFPFLLDYHLTKKSWSF